MSKGFNLIKSKPFFLLLIIACFFIFLLKLTEIYLFYPILENAFHGQSFDYLNDLISHHRLKSPSTRNLEFYITELPKYINRIIFLSIYILISTYILFRNNSKIFKHFFLAKESGLKLAILRIIVLSFILVSNFPLSVNTLVKLTETATVPPFGWSNEIIDFLIQPDLAYVLGFLFTFFCIGALLGFFSKFMLWGATITGFFVMGIPQFFGKIDHYHILWHLLLLLSVSPAGNCLSIDSWRKNQSQVNLQKTIEYGLPIRVVMILIGLVYFFPGFWKYIFSGLEWAFSENLALKMHSKWIDYNGWLPSFRIDRYPFLYQSAAFATLIIELGFIFALFFKKTRYIFALSALMFHLSVFYFMKINFFSLVILYTVFIDWNRVFSFISKYTNVRLSNNESLSIQAYSKSKLIGILLITGNLLAGSLLINSWPFAVYPTFASIETSTIPSILIRAENNDEEILIEEIPLLSNNFSDKFENSTRLRSFIENILKSNPPNEENINKLISIFLNSSNFQESIHKVTIYEIRLNTNPDSEVKVQNISRAIFETEVH